MLCLDGCCCFFYTESNILASMFDSRIHKSNSTCNKFIYLFLKLKIVRVRLFGFRRQSSALGSPLSSDGSDFLRTLNQNFSHADAPGPHTDSFRTTTFRFFPPARVGWCALWL